MKQLEIVNNIHKNAVCIQPRDWSRDIWIKIGASLYFPVKSFAFPVDTEIFKPLKETNDRNNLTNVFLYYKRRDPDEMIFLIEFLNSKNIPFKIFNYLERYEERDYIEYLQDCKYGIWLDAHESQGFALEEALSMNVPLLVWNVTKMKQEYMSNYDDSFATTIPYWDERCGESFKNINELPDKFNKFMNDLNHYKPRDYILENLSIEKCNEKFIQLVNKI
jgi:hypothetical protein